MLDREPEMPMSSFIRDDPEKRVKDRAKESADVSYAGAAKPHMAGAGLPIRLDA
jgi:hypothetical protein